MRNRYEVRGDVTVIYLEKDGKPFKETFVDTIDLDKLLSFKVKWFSYLDKKQNKYYVRGTTNRSENGIRKTTTHLLHRFITDSEPGMPVDHFDGNTLNNRRSTNLRVVTASGNMQNRIKHKNNTSGTVGVMWVKRDKRWKAVLKHQGKLVFQKNCNSYDEAVIEANNARKKYHPNHNEKRNA